MSAPSEPSLTVSDLHESPEDLTSPIESHDLYFRMGDVSLLVNVQGGAGFSWALGRMGQKTQEHGSRNTNAEGEYKRSVPRKPCGLCGGTGIAKPISQEELDEANRAMATIQETLNRLHDKESR